MAKNTNHVLENKLKSFLESKKIKNILIITGQKSFNFSGFKKLEIYKKFKSIMTILYKKNEIPEIQELEYLIKKINIINPDLIIALGGGCVIDYAKLANGLYNIKNLRKKIKSSTLKVNSKKTIILAIPTTAGSGAEVTKFSVIYIDKIKYSVEHNLLKPDFFSLIPKLVLNSPKIVRSSSGFDAIAQATESLFSRNSNKRSLIYSLISLKYSLNNFVNFVRKPNLKNSLAMLNASNFSGQSINIAKTNAPHALSYYFTSKFNLLHGIAVSIFFKEFINYFYFHKNKSFSKFDLNKRFLIFFRFLKIKSILDFNKIFNNLLSRSGLINYIEKYQKISRNNKNVNTIINYVNKERLNNSPIKLKYIDLQKILLNVK